MIAAEFVEPYRREIPDAELHRDPWAEQMHEAREVAHSFGVLLHDKLSGNYEPNTADLERLRLYPRWGMHAIANLEDAFIDSGEPWMKENNELNFQRLTLHFTNMWKHFLRGTRPTKLEIKRAQDSLALHGMMGYKIKSDNASAANGYAYFEEENNEYRASSEGIIGEHDAAVVLLEVAKRVPGMIVLPAPDQFEHDRPRYAKGTSPNGEKFTGPNRNTDFIVMLGEQVVGAQVKSYIDGERPNNYDKHRIILIDGSHDLGNQRAMRTRRSYLKTVSWSGMICAERMLTTPFSAAGKLGIPPHSLIVTKGIARTMMKDVNPHLQKATDRVQDRLLAKLQLTE
ncbi:MAG: hypothetical protein JWN38_1116 [Candidatus Saccharibacteria bacterium]|nr:hypothetical protein [Candidatus Saccharibacteria bacterium]